MVIKVYEMVGVLSHFDAGTPLVERVVLHIQSSFEQLTVMLLQKLLQVATKGDLVKVILVTMVLQILYSNKDTIGGSICKTNSTYGYFLKKVFL